MVGGGGASCGELLKSGGDWEGWVEAGGNLGGRKSRAEAKGARMHRAHAPGLQGKQARPQ